MDEPVVAYGRPAHAQHVYMPFYRGNLTYTSEDPILNDQQQYKYMTVDDMKSLADDTRMDVTNDEKSDNRLSMAPSSISDHMSSIQANQFYAAKAKQLQAEKLHTTDNVDINRHPITVGVIANVALYNDEWYALECYLMNLGPIRKGLGLIRNSFLVSFLVDARGGAMRGCRHSGVRVIVPPQCAASPTRITCRYVRPLRIANPPPLMEGEALASRVLELGPVGAKFLGPVILEVPHFASLRGKQREIIVLRSENGETWKEHTLDASEEAIQDVLNHSFEGEELNQIEDLHTSRITRILTNDFPHYFAIVSRIRQEVHAIGPEGGTVSSSAVPLVQAVFPQNALTKKIRAQAIEPETVARLLGHGVAVSPVVTVEPRRRKFHKAIMLSMPAPRAHSQGMINQYSGSAPTLRLLCSITGEPDTIHRADFRLSDICNLLDDDWEKLAAELDIPPSDVRLIKDEYPDNKPQQSMIMFRLWLRQKANKATGNQLEQALNKIGRSDIVTKCICNVELVTDDMERALARLHLDQSGFETFKDELGPSRDNSLHRGATINKKLAISEDEYDISQKSGGLTDNDLKTISTAEPSLDNDLADTLSDYLNFKNEKEKERMVVSNLIEAIPNTEEKFVNDGLEKGLNLQAEKFDVVTSTPIKPADPVAELKQNVSDTLTFLHKERNDFLPLDDIIIPSRKDDHVANEIDLSSSKIKKKRVIDFDIDVTPTEEDLRAIAENEIEEVIQKAESTVNEVIPRPTQLPVNDVEKMCRMREIGNGQAICEEISSDVDREEAILKAHEVFKFLENETTPTGTHLPNSGIPVPKPRAKEDIEILSSDGERSVSPDDFLSKIPVSGKGKMKTIKKHSKDPLKEEFVKLTQDVNWDEDADNDAIIVATDPIVKTTVTRITSHQLPDEVKNNIAFAEVSSKSKIPVLMTETTRILPLETRTVISPTSTQVIETTMISPGSETKSSVRSKNSTLDSDSDSDSRRSPPLKGILKKAGLKMVGSSSGSDIALHEAGSELSEDESEDFCQNDQPQFSEVTTEEIDPVTGAKVTRTVRTISRTTVQNDTDLQ
ncbi:hypothetical protein FQR65_LT01581 [Abscondita terminalis]|nr:hypothetical protein FQR65_LT01581 [Abscondita terminalis]